MADPLNPDVAWAVRDLKDRAPALKRRRDYYEGRHLPVVPPANTLSPLVHAILEDLTDNLCEDVVDEPVSRLAITSWSIQGNGGTPVAQAAQEKWTQNRGPLREPATYRDMTGLGDAFTIVDKPADRPSVWQVAAPEQIAVRYWEDRPDLLEVAAKVWRQGKRWRLNLYYGPEHPAGARLERYASRGTSTDGALPEAKAFLPLGADELPRDGVTGEPDLGARDWDRIPVFHYPMGEVGRYGRSILTNVIPLQDLLNKAIADLVVNMEDTALPQRFGTGIQAQRDPLTGQEVPLRRRAREAADMLTTASPEAAFGQFAAADMTPFMAVIQGWRVEIARKGYLPPYSVGMDAATGALSGLSLLVQEGRQIKRGQAIQRTAETVWKEQMAYMLRLDGFQVDAEDLDVEWAPLATRDETALWELLLVKRGMGVPDEVLLVEGGYDQDDVERWLEDRDAAQGGRVSAAGPGIASVTMPGVPGGLGLPAAPMPPAGAARPGLPVG